ncbi:MAG: AMP-binding protein [Halieaceae bacterium]|jgi:hypothetical protein|nr:AMP-binding protein [Halieaceae bacterium]
MYKLSELNQTSYTATHAVALDSGRVIDWACFVADIEATGVQVNARETAVWALFHTNTYDFAVGLIALLAQNRTVYLPAENHAGLTADLQSQQINLLGQFPSPTCRKIVTGGQLGSAGDLVLGGEIVVYTSGSTGAPKPIPKTLHQLDQELLTLESHWGANWRDPVIASTVSHQHFYGLLFSLLWPLCAGRRFCHKPFVDPAYMSSCTSTLGEAVWVMSPAHLHRLPRNMPWEKAQGKVNAIFSSGGPLQQQAAQQVYDALHQYPVEVLGSSETGGIASRQQIDSSAPWQPLPRVGIQLDESGTLAVRSPWLEDEKWYVTADLACLSPGGTFQLGMRADRIVKLEGKRVVLPEIEAVLAGHPWIDEAAVLVISRQRTHVGAVLALTPAGLSAEADKGRHAFTRDLRHYLREHLSSTAIPRLWRVVQAVPRNAQGKVLVESMRSLFEHGSLPRLLRRQDSENGCLLELLVTADNPCFEGHFPQRPVLPGVVQLLWAQHFGKEYLGVTGEFSGMKAIKFRNLIFPKMKLSLHLEYAKKLGRLKFHFDSSMGRHSQGVLLYEVRV